MAARDPGLWAVTEGVSRTAHSHTVPQPVCGTCRPGQKCWFVNPHFGHESTLLASLSKIPLVSITRGEASCHDLPTKTSTWQATEACRPPQEWAEKWVLWPRPSLDTAIDPANSLVTPLWDPRSTQQLLASRPSETVGDTVCCLKPLSAGVICYAAVKANTALHPQVSALELGSGKRSADTTGRCGFRLRTHPTCFTGQERRHTLFLSSSEYSCTQH